MKMKIRFINKKTCSLVLAGALVITPVLGTVGCSNNEEEITIETEKKVEDNIELASTEQDVVQYFNEMYTDISSYLNSEDAQKYKYEINHILAEMTGFIFYDDPIMGYSLKDLSDSSKQKIGEIWTKTELLLDEKYPGFVASVNDKFNESQNKGLELYNSGKNKLDTLLYQNLGEDNYTKVMETKEKLYSEFQEDSDKVKSYVKDWYNEYNGEN